MMVLRPAAIAWSRALSALRNGVQRACVDPLSILNDESETNQVAVRFRQRR